LFFSTVLQAQKTTAIYLPTSKVIIIKLAAKPTKKKKSGHMTDVVEVLGPLPYTLSQLMPSLNGHFFFLVLILSP
jgi:hypothetical protein